MIGAVRKEVRGYVESIVATARAHHWSVAKMRLAIQGGMKDVKPGTRLRRIWLEELRRAKAPIRRLPDNRQLQLFGDVA
jgi:hypothetical protein